MQSVLLLLTVYYQNSDGFLWIPVENCASVSSLLTTGTCIGTVTEMLDEATDMPPVTDAQCLGVQVRAPERVKHLFDTLKLTRRTSTLEQFNSLKKLIADNADLIALDDSEIGHTDLVKHQLLR